MLDKPLVSIILPVYNGERTLRATIDSLLAQTFTDFELIVGIDGTTDGSKAIVEHYIDSRIRLFVHPNNLGLAENVNALIKQMHSKSLYIAMAEQDDIYVPERLEWQLAIMQNHTEVGLVSGIAEFKSDNNTVLFPGILVKGQQFPQGEVLFTYLYENQLKVVNTCMMIKREVYEAHSMRFRNTYGNFNVDWDFILRFSLVSQIYGIPKLLVQMNRGLVNNSVTRDKSTQHRASRQLLKDFKKEFPYLINNQFYKKALKQHRKIELGHQKKYIILIRVLYYSLIYFDVYFIKYLMERFKKYFKSKIYTIA